MRVLLASGLTAAYLLVACSGCSSMKMPSFLTAKNKNKQNAAELANAPAPPGTYSATGMSPSSTPPSDGNWSNLPVHPGTNYPQTPYPEHAMAPAYRAPGVPMGQPAGPPENQYAQNYGAMPPHVADNSANAYAQPASSGGQAPAYAPGSVGSYAGAQATTQAPTYQPPAAPTYAQQAAPYPQPSPYPQQPSPYPQQQATAPPQTAPYSQPQSNPYAQQQTTPYGDPYAGSAPYNASAPSGAYR